MLIKISALIYYLMTAKILSHLWLAAAAVARPLHQKQIANKPLLHVVYLTVFIIGKIVKGQFELPFYL